MGLLQDKLTEESINFINALDAIAFIAKHTADDHIHVAKYLINRQFDQYTETFIKDDFYKFHPHEMIDHTGSYLKTYDICIVVFNLNILSYDSELSLNGFNYPELISIENCYWEKSSFFNNPVIKELGLTEYGFQVFKGTKSTKNISIDTFLTNKFPAVNTPRYVRKLFKQDSFTVSEASLFLHSNRSDDGKYLFNDTPTAENIEFIEDGIEMGDIQTDEHGNIPKLSLQSFLYSRDYRIAGFNDHISNSLQNKPTEKFAEYENKIANLELDVAIEKSKAQQLNEEIEHLNAKIVELENEKMQFSQKENATNEEEIKLLNSDLLLIAALLRMLQNEIKVSRNKSQAKVLQRIEDDHKGITGLSKSRTDKIMASANKLYKPLINKKIK